MTSAAWLNRQGEKAERQDKNVPENLFERQPTRGGKNVHETNENERAKRARQPASKTNKNERAKLGLPPSARHHDPPERKQRACMRPASPSETNAHARPCKNMMINKINRGHQYSNQSFRDQSSSVCFMLRVHPTPYLIRANMEKLLLINHFLVC